MMRLAVLLFPAALLLPSWSLERGNLRNGDRSDVRSVDAVEHLLVDIDQSVRKAGGDEEMIFATLYTYDQQLEESLSGEISAMNETLAKLSEMRAAYKAKVDESRGQLLRLAAAAHNSERNATSYQAGTLKAGKQFDSLSSSVKMLSKILESAAVTPNGALVTPEAPDAQGQPTRIFAAIRGLLAANRVIQPHFADVFSAFGPPLPSTSKRVRTSSKSHSQVPASQARRVRVTPKLLARTLSALNAIQARLSFQKAQSLTELQSRQQALVNQASAAQAQEAEQQGIMAESEEVLAELAFSITFTSAVVGLDRRFLGQVQGRMKAKAEIVDKIRAVRHAQLKTITDVTDLLSGKYTVDAAVSFLETGSQTEVGYSQKDLLLEIDTALRHKADTHSILLRIKAMLDDSSSAVVHPAKVQAIVKEFGSVLHNLDLDQARADDARHKCEAQKLHSAQEQEELKANLAVMSSMQDHTKAALWAARSNMKRIVAKRQALKGSAKVFSHTVSQAMSTLSAQSNDRKTMMAAVEKAGDVVAQSLGEKSAAIALLDQLHKELAAQEELETHYREGQSSFHASFLDYVGDYLQVLRERRGHYERSLSALELYASEVQGDTAAGAQALGTSGELASEREDLCESITRFYERHHQRHVKLANSVRSLLPRVSGLLGDSTA